MKIAVMLIVLLGAFSGTAAALRCEDACLSGLKQCRSNCPKSVYDAESGKNLYRTDAERLCQSACESGSSACQRDCA